MSQTSSMIADASSVGIAYGNRLLKDVPTERFARFSAPGSTTIQANHPAFILGHLSLYPMKTLELLGQDTSAVVPPDNYEELFSKTATCQDDPEGSIYPASDELIAVFNKCYEAGIAGLREATDDKLAEENPIDTPMKQMCPTLGGLLTFYMTSHVLTHLGQLSTWRRMEGMQPA